MMRLGVTPVAPDTCWTMRCTSSAACWSLAGSLPKIFTPSCERMPVEIISTRPSMGCRKPGTKPGTERRAFIMSLTS